MKCVKKLLFAIIFMFGTICVVTSSAFGWFVRGYRINNVTVSGTSLCSYFSSGDGDKDNPYIITSPVHLYNLAWLQYTGYFNQCDDNKKLTQPYFRLDKNLDMTGYILPPIGTADNPFIGNFNGNYKTITNLTVSNSTDNSGINNVPAGGFDSSGTEIIGFFGVVGDYNKVLSNYTYSTSVISVYNFYLDKITIKTQTSNTLVGLVAGYVNGNVQNVGVVRGAINATATTDNKISKLSTFDNLSKSSLIGAYSNGVSWSNLPGEGFGGSLDMYTFNKRLTYIYGATLAKIAKNNVVTATNSLATSNDNYKNTYGYHAYLNNSINSYFCVSDKNVSELTALTNSKVMSIMSGSYLPLNVDTDKMFNIADDETDVLTTKFTYTYNNTTTTRNLYATSYYSANSFASMSESVQSSNTGYIVAGNASSEDYANPDIQAIVGMAARFENSLTTESSTKISSLKLYSFNDTSKTPQEISSTNSYARYKDVITQLKSSFKVLNYTTQDVVLAYNAFRFTTKISTSTNFEASDITLSNNHYDTYYFLPSSINFNLSKSGYITAVFGNNVSTKTMAYMFNLYKLTRDADTHKITSATKITTASDSTGEKYNSSWYPTDGLPGYYLYYVEIPVEAGEYAIGCESGQSPLFLYLDVGANGSTGGSGNSADGSQLVIKDVCFLSAVPESWGEGSPKIINITIEITEMDAAVYIYFLRSSSDSNTMYYYCIYSGSNTFTFTEVKDTGITVESNSAANWNNTTSSSASD